MNTPPILMPHAVCWAAAPHLIWTMVVANLVTFLSYVTLCGALLLIAGKTFRNMARDWVWFLVGFALFIVACGSTHLMDVITTWIPVFWIDAWTTIVTAVLSAYVAIMLIRRAGHNQLCDQRIRRPPSIHRAGERRYVRRTARGAQA